ncbi:hypothetical protein, partial [Bradyrhizobium sp.]|uniref:hypothetical protein n=1 Tax=Bradyrhizobium sp. TaxID=376 RepID=UPI003C429DE9
GTTRFRRPRPRRSSVATAASTAFRSTFVTIAKRPSDGTEREQCSLISANRKANYFRADGFFCGWPMSTWRDGQMTNGRVEVITSVEWR